MGVAEKLERIARFLPGVAGYQDRETARAMDKKVRGRLADRLRALTREVEKEERRLTEKKALDRLAVLGRIRAKFDELAGRITFASRGYRGFFDPDKLTQEKLEHLYEFDLHLFEEIESLAAAVEKLRVEEEDDRAFSKAAEAMVSALDGFESVFTRRAEILIGR